MSKYSNKRETPEALATLGHIKRITRDMYEVIGNLMDKTAISIMQHYYKGQRWVIIHDEWVKLVVEGGELSARDDNGELILLAREDIIDILDMMEEGLIYADKCGRQYTPPFAPLLIESQGDGGQNHERGSAPRPLPRSRRRAVKIR